jgi:hypothetical protein
MADDFYGYDEEADEPKGRDNLFLWTVFILLLVGVAFACWLGSFYVFAHPENPKAYAILKKVHKIDVLRRFEVTAAPPGEFLSAQRLFERYSKFTPLELANENGQLFRNYMNNYRETKKLVPYVTGRYLILDSSDLNAKTTTFPSGMVALAQAAELPQVLIEHVYPASPKMLPAMRVSLQTGNPIKLERTNDLAAVIHIEKTSAGRLQFTVVPLLYGNYGGATAFSLEPPADLNMEPRLPVVKTTAMEEALKKYAEYRLKHPAVTAEGEPVPTTAAGGQEIVRVDVTEPGKPVPETGAMPAVNVATPVPIPGRVPPRLAAVSTPAMAATPRLAAVATPAPPQLVTKLYTPPPVPVATPMLANGAGNPTARSTPFALPTPAPVARTTPLPSTSPDGIPLKKFFDVTAKGDPNMPNAGATWKTYAPGLAPPARAVSLDEVGPIADRGDVGERLYLRGEFRVTASGPNRAVLRDATKPDDQSPRVVVEYPAGAVPPQERDRFVRDNSRPYLINDVRRGADGVVTIYVKEIIAQ